MESIKASLNEEERQYVARIQLATRRLLRGAVSGINKTRQRGYGLEFDQLREYEAGDDVRHIDWNASARSSGLMIRQYLKEQNRILLIALDISASMQYGPTDGAIWTYAQRAALIMTTIAEYTRAQCGLLLFADTVIEYIPPASGQNFIRTLVSKILTSKPLPNSTCLESLFKKLLQIKKKEVVLIIISDFIERLPSAMIANVAACYEVINLRILDSVEKYWPLVGGIYLVDSETGQNHFLPDTQSVTSVLNERLEEQELFYKRYKVAVLDLDTKDDIINKLVRFFARRLLKEV